MFKCSQCGAVATTEKVRFCTKCGAANVDLGSADPLADKLKEWASEHIDQPQMVQQYVSILTEFYFDFHNSADVIKFSVRIRERLKISFETHTNVIDKLAAQKKAIAHMANFRFEFNENVAEAYAGHDTFLGFRYTNLAEDDLFKISLVWDDPETTDRIDLRAQTSTFVKPQGSATFGASVIFDRIGIKELTDMQIIIADQFGETATFKAEPFSFKVGHHDQRITQNISTHNQISIEGRGVVDASGMGAERSAIHPSTSIHPRWRSLSFRYEPKGVNAQTNAAIETKIRSEQEQPKVGTVESSKTTAIAFNKDDLPSVLKAAEQGNADAQVALALMYEVGSGVSKDDELAVNWFRKAAEQGHADAQSNLAYFYNNGIGIAQNYDKSEQWYRKAAEQGHEKAQYNLGLHYQIGKGVAQSDEQAAQWYLKAAEQGLAIAEAELGNCYYFGAGVTQNYENAAHWCKKAAEQGHAMAQDMLANCYYFGAGVTQNYENAAHWCKKAAEQGHAMAQDMLGNCYYLGTGVALNYEQAAHWYQKAAEQGVVNAQSILGVQYGTGQGVAENHQQAAHWYREAADQGDALSQYNLGVLYEIGNGVVQNAQEAAHWYRKAAEQGNERAIANLKRLEFPKATAEPPTDGHGSWDYGAHSYTGMYKNGQWNGLGELTWSGNDLGHKYVGNFVNGQRTGQGTHYFPNGTTQVGIFANGVYQEPQDQIDDADTDEHLSFNDGSSYAGGVKDGKAEGFGVMTFANGDSMYGNFENGIMNDEAAHYDFADGGTYDGPMAAFGPTWKSTFSGHGTRKFGGKFVGHSYTGNFENGYFNGQGTYFFPDGSTNVGQFKDGTFVPPKSEKPDYIYAGETYKGIPHGVGKMTWNDGDVYKGDFVNGVRHGLGEFTYADKTKLTGQFENNVFLKNASFTENVKIGYKIGTLDFI